VICHGVTISRQSARKQIRNLDSSKGIWKIHLMSWGAWLMLYLSCQVWNMPALYRILISSKTVMHWRESRGLLAGSQVSTIGVQALLLLLHQLHLQPLEERRCIRLSCIKFWTNMWQCRWISWIWFCVIDLSEDLLPNKDLRYVVVLQLSFRSLLLQELLLSGTHYQTITSLASVSSFRSQLSATSRPKACTLHCRNIGQ